MYNLISNLHDFVHVMGGQYFVYIQENRTNDSRIVSLQDTRLAIT